MTIAAYDLRFQLRNQLNAIVDRNANGWRNPLEKNSRRPPEVEIKTPLTVFKRGALPVTLDALQLHGVILGNLDAIREFNECMRHILTKHITKSGMNRLVYCGLASLMLAGGLALQPTAVGQVVITVAPPSPIVEKVPPSRGPNWVWDPGHHVWRGGHYVWVPGHYIKKPRPTAVWVPGHYDKRGKGWVWVDGHWG